MCVIIVTRRVIIARVCHSRRPLQGSQLQTQYQQQGSSKNHHHGHTHQMATAEDQAPDMESEFHPCRQNVMSLLDLTGF